MLIGGFSVKMLPLFILGCLSVINKKMDDRHSQNRKENLKLVTVNTFVQKKRWTMSCSIYPATGSQYSAGPNTYHKLYRRWKDDEFGGTVVHTCHFDDFFT
ncbi:hypothetical protein DPMN_102662 [Dreissena polymorpha]|uniref:Uncharacterized protein n=1 Tax=Dreissena polymorpha TaxID=45954 RepID=A0A9D4LNB0_DREPO|nr:hypothetical protein DPMN_102662 [Dreissena polymorpha]